MDQGLMFSSASSEWETPIHVVRATEKLIRKKFTRDACAANEKVSRVPGNFFSPKDDALVQHWYGNVWMNPPYGRGISVWIEKAYEEARMHADVVACLLPARTDTQYFHNICVKGNIYLIEGRITFEVKGVPSDAAPFPSMIVVFRRRIKEPTIRPWKIPA